MVHSPPRPRVRRNDVSGASTMLAGVEHLSTAHSPFMRTPAPAAAAAAGPQATPSSAGNGSSSSSGRLPQEPLMRVVTDPTHPSVALGATWLPPVLAALQAALSSSGNLKVRIAAAHGLATVPSRESYRIPLPQGGAPAGAGASDGAAAAPGGSGRLPAAGSSSAATVAGASAAAPAPLLPLPGGAAPLDVAAPYLQQPGFDAFPSALISLVTALEAAEGGGGQGGGAAAALRLAARDPHAGTSLRPTPAAAAAAVPAVAAAAAGAAAGPPLEERYRAPLLAAVRLGLVHTLLLAERLDYGRMKPFLDAHAAALLEWLAAEEAALRGAGGGGAGAGLGEGSELVRAGASVAAGGRSVQRDEGAGIAAAGSDGAKASAEASAAGAASAFRGAAFPGMPRGVVGSPARQLPRPAAAVAAGHAAASPSRSAAPTPTAAAAPRHALARQAGISLRTVAAVLRSLSQLFSSRVKSIPPPLLRAYQAREAALAAELQLWR
jgi:hypothetical protein